MEWSVFFVEKVRASADKFVKEARGISGERRFEAPQNGRSATRIVYHMLYYEREVALPGAKRLLQGGPGPDDETILAAEDEHWEREGSAMTYDAMLEAFERTRAEQIALAPQLAPLWNAPCVPDVEHPA